MELLTEINQGRKQGAVLIEQVSIAAAFIKKDIKIALSYKLQFTFQFLQVFFGVALIYYIGKMVGNNGRAIKAYGADYFSFALIGLAVNSYLRAGLISITNDIRQTMNQGTLEAMCAAPLNYTQLLFYISLWQFIFETVCIVFYFLLAIFLFGLKLPNADWPAAILVLAVSVPIFLLLGIISCSILVVVKRGDPINWFFSHLSALLAGTMFPLSVLPKWLQNVSFCLPLTHSLEAIRKTMLAGAGLNDIRNNILALMVFNFFLIPLTFYINRVCMKYAKKQGAFSTH